MSNKSYAGLNLDLDDIPEVVMPTNNGNTFTVTGEGNARGERDLTVQVGDWPECEQVVRDLAEIWQQRGGDRRMHTLTQNRWHLQRFWDWCRDEGVTVLQDVTPDRLMQFTQHAHTYEDVGKVVGTVRNYLAWYDEANPGVLPQGTSNELTHDNPVPHKHRQGTEGLPQPVLRAVQDAVDKHITTVQAELQKHRDAGEEFFLTWEQSYAFYIRLLFELLWSDDVLKELVLDPPDDPTLPVQNDGRYLTKALKWDDEEVVLQFHKHRAGNQGVYTDSADVQPTSPHDGGESMDEARYEAKSDKEALLRLFRDATADTRRWHEQWRQTAPDDVKKRFPRFSPWLYVHTPRRAKDGSIHPNQTRWVDWPVIDAPVHTSVGWGTVKRLVKPTFSDRSDLGFREWAERQEFPQDVWEEMADLTWDPARLTVTAYGRLHKAARQEDLSLDQTVTFHQIQTHFKHYMGDRATKQELHAAWLDTTDIARDVTKRGDKPYMPLLLISPHEQVTEIAGFGGLAEPEDDIEVITEILAGTRNVGLIACRSNGKQSPFLSNPQSEDDCPQMFRLCWHCPLAAVTPGHITAMKNTRTELLRRKPTMVPEVWAMHWQPVVTFIEQTLQHEAFTDATATPQFPYIPLDPGVQGR